MSSPLQIAVLALLGAALWSIFYIVNVLSGDSEEPGAERGSARSSLQESENERALEDT